MVDENDFPEHEAGENTMLREAMAALRQGDRPRARDLLTRLLKVDQNNATYWTWLSAAVESQKERLYCLQTALRLDPQNAAAKRGLVLLGGLEADESIPPFPLKHARAWEEMLYIPHEPVEKPRGWANPLVKLLVGLVFAGLALGVFYGGSTLYNTWKNRPLAYVTPTHRATFTLTLTPSLTPAFRTATPTFLGATPLSHFLVATYTKTPLYVVTEHPVLTSSAFKSGLRFLESGQYETARVQFRQVLDNEPEAVDAYYYIGESYRLEGNFSKARDANQAAINIKPDFAPAFLGRALANLGLNPEADVLADLDSAIAIDPLYMEAYLQRGAFHLGVGDTAAALQDLQTTLELNPGSPLAWMYLAQAQMQAGEFEEGLQSALTANQLDMTLVPVYLTLAQAYIATGQTAQAAAVLQTYTIYAPDDVAAFLWLGTAYNEAEDYEAALGALNRYLDAYPRDAEAYYQRGTTYLMLENPNLAEADFKKAIGYDPYDFDAQLSLSVAYFDQGYPGNAYIQIEQHALPLAKTDSTKAQVYFLEAIYLEAIGDAQSLLGARNSWNRLIALPPDAMPEDVRQMAYERLGVTPTFTATLRPTRTLTPTVTPKP